MGAKMKIDLCNYSGYKCYPSRGITYVKADGKTFRFLDGRSKKAHLLKRNPRKVTWTVLYRRKQRKAQRDEAIRAAKEVKKTKKDTKAKAAPKEAKPKTKAPKAAAKNGQKSAPRVGGKR